MKKKKDSRGGAREGAGRPKKEATKTMRVPVSLVEKVKKLIRDAQKPTASNPG